MEDNRDFGVIPCFDTVEEQRKLDEMRRQTFCEQCDMMKLTDLLLKAIASIGRAKCTAKQPFIFLQELEKYVEYCRQTYKTNSSAPQMLQSPPPLYLSEYVNTPKIDLLMRLIRSGVSLVDYVKELISNTASAFNSTTGPLSVHLSLRHYSMVLQTIALARLAIRSLEIVLDSVSGLSSVNQRNKKISTAKNLRKNVVSNRLCEIRASLKKGISLINVQLSDIYKLLTNDDLIPNFSSDFDEETCKILQEEKADVDWAIITSYDASITDMQKAVKHMLDSK
ncbi:unnamed protein product [Gongylonema pulchrum]|uniref:Conserved oligomeric Golgi complex subunit 3 n=1 Tax=Gongylonema pulchrum TaxID=637853 RepID=A0A183EH44_9BILA|nr:unnamed protein product [Gongylonema pulchrum]